MASTTPTIGCESAYAQHPTRASRHGRRLQRTNARCLLSRSTDTAARSLTTHRDPSGRSGWARPPITTTALAGSPVWDLPDGIYRRPQCSGTRRFDAWSNSYLCNSQAAITSGRDMVEPPVPSSLDAEVEATRTRVERPAPAGLA
uniref:Uncharacterized protein n=1 Tax=Setaria italica TaxID=4555 RepID=K3YCG6_SETIT